jgi:hypothetical protein
LSAGHKNRKGVFDEYKTVFYFRVAGGSAGMGLVLAGCDTGSSSGGDEGGGDGGGNGSFDSALAATWHSTQDAANSGASVVFEFTSGGRLTIAGQSNMEITVTTSGGRISATVTTGGQTVDGGSVAYVVSGTTLTFSDPSVSGMNVFQSLVTGQQIAGCYYKSSNGSGGGGNNNGDGGGGNGGFDSGLVATWHSTQNAANGGTSIVFEFTADHKLIITGSSMAITVTTSGGRISAAVTAGGQTVDGGSVAYLVSGTTLTIYDPSTGGMNVFQPLVTAGQSTHFKPNTVPLPADLQNTKWYRSEAGYLKNSTFIFETTTISFSSNLPVPYISLTYRVASVADGGAITLYDSSGNTVSLCTSYVISTDAYPKLTLSGGSGSVAYKESGYDRELYFFCGGGGYLY